MTVALVLTVVCLSVVALVRSETRKQAMGKAIGKQLRDGEDVWTRANDNDGGNR